MIRSEYLLLGAVVLLSWVLACLAMLAGSCGACTSHGLGYDLSGLAAGLLSAGAVVGMIFLLVTLWRTRRLWRLCHTALVDHPPVLRQACRRLAIRPERVMCTSQADLTVFCIGWWRPRIVISKGLVETVAPAELLAILVHERHHQLRRDPLRLLLMKFIHALLFPLPVVHELHRAFLLRIEVEADEAAIEVVGRPSVASALYKMFTANQTIGQTLQPLPIAPFQPSAARLEYLLQPDQPPFASLFSVRQMVLSLLPFLAFCLTMILH